MAGNKIAKVIDPIAEETYWRTNYASRPQVTCRATFDEYGPAYRYGVDAYGRHDGRSFEQAEPGLVRDWDRVKGTSKLTWENAEHATPAHAHERHLDSAGSIKGRFATLPGRNACDRVRATVIPDSGFASVLYENF